MRKLTSFLLCLLLLLAFTVMAGAADGIPVQSADDLLALMNKTGAFSDWTADYYLTGDIDLSAYTGDLVQRPIGSTAKNAQFKGSFDGCGYTVSGLSLSATTETNQALFGGVGAAGVTMMIKNLTVEGTVTGGTATNAGIVGRVWSGTVITVENCTSRVTVSGKVPGGIIGYVGNATSAEVTVRGCKNEGNLTVASSSYGGGIFGYYQQAASAGTGSLTVVNCLNTGTVTGTNAGSIGGLCSITSASPKATASVTDCMSTGTASSGKTFFVTGSATTVVKNIVYTNIYAPNDTTLAPAGKVTANNCFIKDQAPTLTGANWMHTDEKGYELASFHTHISVADNGDGTHTIDCYCDAAGAFAHTYEAGFCTVCGAEYACAHTAKTEVFRTPSTCTTAGSITYTCDECGKTLDPVALPLDPGNHEDVNYDWLTDGTNFYYNCDACGEVAHTQKTAPVLYLNKTSGDNTADGLTPETAVKAITTATDRLAATGGTVVLTADYVLAAACNFRAWENTVTFTSLTGENGLPLYAIGNTATSRTVSFLGDAVFENIRFAGKEGTTLPYICFYAQWNDLTFDNIHTDGACYTKVFAGNAATVKTDDTDAAAARIRITGAANIPADGRRFYEEVWAGSALGAEGQVVANKTVTLDITDADVSKIYFASTTSAVPTATTENCATTVNMRGSAHVGNAYTGNESVHFGESKGAGKLESLTVNMYGNSTYAYFHSHNTETVVLNVSSEADGRTVKLASTAYFYGRNEFAETPYTVEANFGSHSVKAGTTPAMLSAVTPGAGVLTLNVTDECTWDDGVFTMVDTHTAKTVYTCTACGGTRAEDLTVEDDALNDARMIALGNGDIAFLSAVDSLAYEAVGFEITVNGDTETFTVDTAYDTVTAGSAAFASDDFGIADGYVYGLIVKGIPEGAEISFAKVLNGGANG